MIRTVNLATGEETFRDYTQEELDAIAAFPQPDPKNAIRAQIKQLEAEQLMPRAVREYMLLDLEYRFPAEVLAVNPGYQAVKAFDNQIKALRDQL